METENKATPLEDGLYHSMVKNHNDLWFYIKDGSLWLPTDILPMLVWADADRLIKVEDKIFMCASEIIQALPGNEAAIRNFAAKHGVAA